MTNLPTWLSIVTVVKDDPAGLADTRESLAAQDMTGVEWVVLDSSKDSDLIRRLTQTPEAPAVYEWRRPEGVYAAMNSALGLVSGNYTWFVNAGDRVAEGATLVTLAEALNAQPVWLMGQVAFIDPDGTRTVPPPFDYALERDHFFARGRFAPHQGTVVHSDWLKRSGGFSASLMIAADYEMSLRLSKAADPVITDRVIADFTTGGLSTQRWAQAVGEFHRARREVLRPSGLDAARELGLTGVSWGRGAAAAALRRLRGGSRAPGPQ